MSKAPVPPTPLPQVLWVLVGIQDNEMTSAVGTDTTLPTAWMRDRQDPCSQPWRQRLNF